MTKAVASALALLLAGLWPGCAAAEAVVAARATVATPPWFDLDGDGVAETQLTIGSCRARHAADCLVIARSGVKAEVVLSERDAMRNPSSTEFHLRGPTITVIGNHTGSPMSEVAVLTAERDAKLYHGLLSVVDVDAKRVVGRARSPDGLFNVFADAARGADGRLHPFLAPSFGASTHPAPELGTAGEWDYLCSFVAGEEDDHCGSGFVAIDIGARRSEDGQHPADYFREVGGYLQDIDGDGWEDVHLIYHYQVRSVSLAKRRLLCATRFDTATDPATLNRVQGGVIEHSGRNFGTHAAVRSRTGALRDVMVGGAPVDALGVRGPPKAEGTPEFRDLYCNVSRFIGVIEGQPGEPATRHLKWDRYFGFDSSSFAFSRNLTVGVPTTRPLPPRLHTGDFMNGCVHRFSDSRVTLAGREAIAVDVFHDSGKRQTCLAEQYQLYFNGWSAGFAVPPGSTVDDAKPWSAIKQRIWNGCKAQNLSCPGQWAFELYDEATGVPLVTVSGGYVWGWSERVVPGATVYFVEPLAASAPFDFTWDFARRRSRPQQVLVAHTLSERGWLRSWRLPVAARPKIVEQAARGARGVGDYSYYAEWQAEDVDGDGLDEVQLADGSWVGYVRAADRFVCKKDCAGAGPSR